MLKKILVFRTDRIGDLIINCPSIISIKKYFTIDRISNVEIKINIIEFKGKLLFDNFASVIHPPAIDPVAKSTTIDPFLPPGIAKEYGFVGKTAFFPPKGATCFQFL